MSRRFHLSDAEVLDFIRSERNYNKPLRRRRADSIQSGESKDIIAHYDHLIYGSDRRLISLYAKNRRCCSTDGM